MPYFSLRSAARSLYFICGGFGVFTVQIPSALLFGIRNATTVQRMSYLGLLSLQFLQLCF